VSAEDVITSAALARRQPGAALMRYGIRQLCFVRGDALALGSVRF